jgi:hypothetical protein
MVTRARLSVEVRNSTPKTAHLLRGLLFGGERFATLLVVVT